MTKVQVNASKEYEIIIGNGILENLGEYVSGVYKNCKIAVITDDIVDSLYSKTATDSLEKAGFETVKFVFENGEASKNFNTYINILEFLAQNHLTRSDAVLALGGGVTGDMAGFAAATYLRGIGFVQVPTTLLAAVDSSVGGKTAIDITAGKNLVGAFYQPDLVVCDYSTLKTLPSEIFRDGCAEAIKYGILGDTELFEHLKNNGLDFDTEYVITRSVEMKRDIVNDDEFDKGRRQLLNLGHTPAHAIELLSNFKVSHGSAVAIGTAIIASAAYKNGICSAETQSEIINVLKRFFLPTKTQFSAEELYNIMLSDKKRTGGTINLVVPHSVGDTRLMKFGIEEIKEFIKAGMI